MTQRLTGPKSRTLSKALAARYEAGASLSELAAETGYTWQAVRYRLLSVGVVLRPRGRRVGR